MSKQAVDGAFSSSGGPPNTDTPWDNFITLVGGTVPNSKEQFQPESGWSLSCGGTYFYEPIPDYQQGLDNPLNQASSVSRNFPDVAAVAQDVTVVVTYPGPGDVGYVGTLDGTSAAAPLWAGFMALANQQNGRNGLPSAGFLNPLLYTIGKTKDTAQDQYKDAFNDVQQGNNAGPNNATGYNAVAGYDLVTGWGSPKCGLINLLSSSSALPNIDLSAGGQHTCSIRSDGSVWCWGANGNGQLGNGTTTDSNAPMPVTAPTTWSANSLKATHVAAGGSHTCALMSDSSVWCWGANASGQLGNSTQTDSAVPVQVTGLTNATGLASGGTHTCAIQGAYPNASVWCWGNNTAGQLGIDVSTSFSSAPVNTNPAIGFYAETILAGDSDTCIVALIDQSAVCWGNNSMGQLGDGNWGVPSSPPVQVSWTGLIMGKGCEVTSLALGNYHSCAVITDLFTCGAGAGETLAWCWGLDSSGQLGDATPSSPPMGGVNPYPSGIYASELFGFQTVTAGSAHTCALQYNGGVYCWGANDMGQLGLGNTSTEVGYPTQVQNLSGVTLTSLGGSHSCALVKDGSISCWGDNTYGQLGVRDNIQRDVPATVHFF